MTAALYSLRGGYSVKIIEKEQFGGQIADSPRVENYPSIKEISGLELTNQMFEQVTSLGCDFDMDEALSIEKTPEGFLTHGKYGDYASKAVIIAAGVKHKRLGIEGEERLKGRGVSYCAVCDGPFYKDKNAMVIGDGNSALQYAIFLSKSCRRVDIVTLFDKFFGDASLVETLKSLPNVHVTHNLNSISFNGDSKLESVSFINTKTNEKVDMRTDGVFVAIGQEPDNERFANLLELDKGYIVVDENCMSKTEGLFAAGDCLKKRWRQVTTACSDGAIASLSAQNFLSVIASKRD